MGIYVFDPKVLIKSLADGERIDFGKGVIPSAIKDHRVFAYPFSGYWEDIGTIKTFFNANINLAQENPEFSLYEPGWPIYTRTRSLPPSRIIGSEIKDSLIVEGSDIHGASIQDSIIGVRSIVNPGAQLKDVVMSGSDYYEGEELLESLEELPSGIPPLGIGENTYIERCIIDKNARIGRDVQIRAKDDSINIEDDLYWVRDGITIIRRGAVIPDGMKI
jgi:glucose-1-phosphate adenylyltransferase